jgi:hypothetical protein
MKKNSLINTIQNIESELNSFENEKNESHLLLNSNKNKIINEVKSGAFEEMLNEINNRQTKKETLLDKIFKLF